VSGNQEATNPAAPFRPPAIGCHDLVQREMKKERIDTWNGIERQPAATSAIESDPRNRYLLTLANGPDSILVSEMQCILRIMQSAESEPRYTGTALEVNAT
jgi:hypothetical protein